MKASSLIIGVAVGIVGGAAAVLMSTPTSGKQVRSNLVNMKNSAQQHLLQVKKDTSDVTQSINTFSSEVKNNIPQIINELKESFVNFTSDIEPETTKLKQEIEALQNTISEFENKLPEKKK